MTNDKNPKQEATNTRRFAREKKRLKVLLTAGQRSVGFFSSEVSLGGFRTEGQAIFPEGTPVLGRFITDRGEFKFAGMVAWTHAADDRRGQRGAMGIRFLKVPSAMLTLLNRV